MALQTIDVISTLDGVSQPCDYAPASTSGRPLVVSCHSAHGRYNSYEFYTQTMDFCAARNWNFLSPDFRGAGNSATYQTQHYGSPQAVQDVLDAMTDVNGRLAYTNAYIVGGSGGGFMASLVAGQNHALFKAMASIVGIADLFRWYRHCFDHDTNTGGGASNLSIYSDSVSASLGGAPNAADAAVRNRYKNQSPISYAKNLATLPCHIQHGYIDQTVPVDFANMFWQELLYHKGYSGQMLSGLEVAAAVWRQEAPLLSLPAIVADQFEAKTGAQLYNVIMKRIAADSELYIMECGHTGDLVRAFDFFDRVQSGAVVGLTGKRAPTTPVDIGQPVS